MANKSNKKWVVGGGVIITAVIAMSFLNLGDNLVYFYTPMEAVAKASELEGQNIKVGGMVKTDTVKWVPEHLSLSFIMTDMNGNEINVAHKGTPPDMFKEGQGVVVEGRLANSGKDMVSHNLMVKHSEEYKSPEDPRSMDHKLLQQSIFKGQESNTEGSGARGN